jgi:hypothetical protein
MEKITIGDFENQNGENHHFLHGLKAFCFFAFFQFVPNSLFQRTKLEKGNLLSASDSHENFFLNRCVMKYYAISHGHIGDGHR